jgi:hypothetical protein
MLRTPLNIGLNWSVKYFTVKELSELPVAG